jgi:hypothetical protein
MCISDKELWRGNVLQSGYLADTEVEGWQWEGSYGKSCCGINGAETSGSSTKINLIRF